MNIKVDFDNIVVKEDKNDFNVKVLMLKGEKGDAGAGEDNIIEVVKVNGTALPVTNKAVDVPVPTVDSALSSSSTNPVQNKVIYNALGSKADATELNNYYEISEVDNLLNNKADTLTVNNIITDIANEITTRANADANLQNQITGLASGSPLVASSTSEMTDTNRVYVNTTDGYWYYYNGTNWVQGGVYQATEDSSNVTNINNALDIGILTEKSENIFDTHFKLNSSIDNSDGSFVTGSEYEHNIATDEYVEIEGDTTYVYYCAEVVGTQISKRAYFYANDKTMIPASESLNYTELTHNGTFKTPVNTKYIRIVCIHLAKTSQEIYNITLKTSIVKTIDNLLYYSYPKLIGTQNIDYDFEDLDKFKNQVLSKQTVNIFDDEFIPTARLGVSSGRFINPDGTTKQSTHKKFIPVTSGEKYIFSNPDTVGTNTTYKAYFYDADKIYVSNSAVAVGTAFTIPNNCYYIRFLITHTNTPATDLANMPYWVLEKGETSHWYLPPKLIETKNIDYNFDLVDDLKSDVENLQEEIEGYSGKNIKEDILINGIITATSLNKTNKYINIGYFTDTHENAYDASKSISFMNKLSLSNICNMCIHGGDIISSYSMNYNQFLTEMLKRINNYKQMKNLYFVKGNHDNNHNNTANYNLTKTEYNMMFNVNLKDVVINENDPYGNYYYVDDKINKVRIIVLDAYYLYSDYSNVNFGTEQTSWLYNNALDITELQDYSVVIFSHSYNRTCEIVDILKAFNDKGNTYGDYTFDGSSNAKFVGLIRGHDHADTYSNADGYNVIGVTKAFSDASDIGTDNEVALDIFTIDTDNDILYETRIGKGSSRSYSFGSTSSRIS